nr:alpha/beta hydrolase [Thiomicrorhabdus marina]
MLFGHGFGCDKSVWDKVAPAFSDGYSVVVFDYVGCGRSDLRLYNHQHYSSLEAYADDLILLCDSLALQKVYFVGHSVSGAIGMLASIKRPDLFIQLITIGPSPHYINEPDYFGGFDKDDVMSLLDMMSLNYFEWANYLAPIAIGQKHDDKYSDNLKLSFLRSDPVISQTFAKVTFLCDIRDQIGDIPIPVCILYCVEDVIVPIEVINYLAQHIPVCQTTKIDGSGHYPQITSPNAVIQGIENCIKATGEN